MVEGIKRQLLKQFTRIQFPVRQSKRLPKLVFTSFPASCSATKGNSLNSPYCKMGRAGSRKAVIEGRLARLGQPTFCLGTLKKALELLQVLVGLGNKLTEKCNKILEQSSFSLHLKSTGKCKDVLKKPFYFGRYKTTFFQYSSFSLYQLPFYLFNPAALGCYWHEDQKVPTLSLGQGILVYKDLITITLNTLCKKLLNGINKCPYFAEKRLFAHLLKTMLARNIK